MSVYEKVEDVKRPLIRGEKLLVPCFVSSLSGDIPVSTLDLNKDNVYITPIINHPHSDKENGQMEVHYHADLRFVQIERGVNWVKARKIRKNHFFLKEVRIHTEETLAG